MLGCGETKPTPAAAGGMTMAGSGGVAAGAAGSGAASGGSGGSASTGGGGGQAGGAGTDKITGTFTLASFVFGSIPGISIAASFPLVTPVTGAGPSTCTWSTHGACSLGRCSPGSGEPAPEPARHHVGPVTLESAEAEVRVVSQPNELGAYQETEDANRTFSGGEAFTFTATGGTLPGFSFAGMSPLLLLVDAPLPAPEGKTITVPVPRTQPFTFTWTRGVANVSMYLQSYAAAADASGDSLSFTCLVDSTLGTATLDAELVAAMPAGAEVNLYTVATGKAESDTSLVHVALVSEAISPEKTAKVRLLFQ